MANTTGKKFGGRVKGTPNKTSRKINEICEADGKLKPSEFLLKTMHDESTEENVRLECAKALLPYTDRKMPVSVEQDNTHTFPASVDVNFIKPKES